tara:strand:- start:250 stop:429 length:180 start_codon:yes stop_codon:yes gene_type:complete
MSLTSKMMLIYGGMLLKENILFLYLIKDFYLCDIRQQIKKMGVSNAMKKTTEYKHDYSF